jgi:uncharacterized Fe-S cluster protein YjdI
MNEYTNFIERPSKYGVNFSGVKGIIYRNEYISRLTSDSFLFNVLKNAVNNGIMLRNTRNIVAKNYWMPLSNAGISPTRKKKHLHESLFFLHDVFHHNFHDLSLFSNSNEFDRMVYSIHRVLGEAVTLLLTDWVFVDEIYHTLSEEDRNFVNMNSRYKCYIALKEFMSLNEIITAHNKYCVTGDDSVFTDKKTGKIPQDVINYLQWSEPVYAADNDWTDINAKEIINHGNKQWDNHVLKNPQLFWTVTNFKKFVNIKEDDKFDEVFTKINDYYVSRINRLSKRNLDVSDEMIETRAIKNYLVYQMKAVFDGFVDYELGKEYYEEIVRLLKQDILSESDLELHNQLYNEISDEIVNGKDFDEKHTVLYKMVYPLFTYNTVTYDKDKQNESLVQSTSRIYKSLK